MKTTKSILKSILMFCLNLIGKVKAMFETVSYGDIESTSIDAKMFFEEDAFFDNHHSKAILLLKRLYFGLQPDEFLHGEVEGDLATCLFYTKNYSVKLTVSAISEKVSVNLWYGTTGIFNETNQMFEKTYDIKRNAMVLLNSIRFDVSKAIFTNTTAYTPSVPERYFDMIDTNEVAFMEMDIDCDVDRTPCLDEIFA